jgi:hypothetical protein
MRNPREKRNFMILLKTKGKRTKKLYGELRSKSRRNWTKK